MLVLNVYDYNQQEHLADLLILQHLQFESTCTSVFNIKK